MEMSWSYTEWHADFEGSTTKHHLVSLCRNRIFRSKEEQHLQLPLVLSLQKTLINIKNLIDFSQILWKKKGIVKHIQRPEIVPEPSLRYNFSVWKELPRRIEVNTNINKTLRIQTERKLGSLKGVPVDRIFQGFLRSSQ